MTGIIRGTPQAVSGLERTSGSTVGSPLLTSQMMAVKQSKLPTPVIIYLLCVVIPIGFNAGLLAMTTLRIFLIIMFLPLFGKLVAGRYGGIFVTDVLFFLHVLWTTVALSVNNPAQAVQQVGSVGVEFLGGYLIGRAYIRTAADFLALCRVLALIVCCTFPFAVFETITGRPLILEAIRRLPGITTVAFNFQDGRMGLERVQLCFAHPIHYGLFCSVVFSLTFVGLKGGIAGPMRYVTSAIIGFCGFLALSSGAILALVLQLGLILWSWVFGGIRRRWLLLSGVFVLAYVVIDILSNRSPIQVFMSYATFSAHTAYWRSIIFEWGMKNIWAYPIFGIGLNDWVRPSYMRSGSMDNFWLVMAVRYGIPGFLLLAIGYVIPIWRIGRRDFSRDAALEKLRRAWMFSFMGLTFTLTTVHVWTNIYSFVFFMFGAGMWMVVTKLEVSRSDTEKASNVVPHLTIRTRYTRFPITARSSFSPKRDL